MFNPLQAMVMTYSLAKDPGQRTVSWKDRVDANRWTDGWRRLHYLTRFVPNNPLPLNRQYLSCDACLEVKREDNQNCSVLLYTTVVHSDMRTNVSSSYSSLNWVLSCWVHFTVHRFIYVYLCSLCFCFLLHMCYSIVSTVGWTWRDWSLILRTKLPSMLWHCWLGHLTGKNLSPIWPIMCLVRR